MPTAGKFYRSWGQVNLCSADDVPRVTQVYRVTL
jgi:hypothetical protein